MYITSTIQYVTIASEGDAIDFGDLATAVLGPAAYSSSTRGIWANGYPGSNSNVIQYVEISTLGDAIDFGARIDAPVPNKKAENPIKKPFLTVDNNFLVNIT